MYLLAQFLLENAHPKIKQIKKIIPKLKIDWVIDCGGKIIGGIAFNNSFIKLIICLCTYTFKISITIRKCLFCFTHLCSGKKSK